MSLTNIPDEHHVARVCPRNRTIRVNGVVVGVHPKLYRLRDFPPPRPKETYLSTQYVEFYDGDFTRRMKKCVKDCSVPLSDKDYMVVLNAGSIRNIGKAYNLKIRVVHDSKNRNPSYSQVIGTPDDETHAMLQAIASDRSAKLLSVTEIKTAT